MEAQMAPGNTASWSRLARRNTGRTSLHCANISLQFERVLISLLNNNSWHFSYMTCIQTMAIKVYTGKHLEREKSGSPSRRSGHTMTFWSPQNNYGSLGMAKHGMNRQAWQTHNLKSMVWFKVIKNKIRKNPSICRTIYDNCIKNENKSSP